MQGIAVLGLSASSLLLLAWLTLQWGILPHIEDWRPTIERHASRAVGVPVHIGHITVHSSAWVPALDLRDVVLTDPSGAEALRLPHISAALSPRSLVAFEPRLVQLYIEDAHLVMRRDAQGRLHVGGLDMAASTTVDDGGAVLDWFFRQEEFVIRHGSLRWIDELRNAPPLELTGVEIVVRNGLRTHELRLDATPPADWGERFSLRARCTQPLFARAGDWRRWSGTAFADLPRAGVAELKRHVDLPFELESGTGAIRLWLDVQAAHWRGVTLDLQVSDLSLRLGPRLEPLAIAHASGRLAAQRDRNGVSLAAEHFGFQTASGVVWPEGDLHLSWQQHQAFEPTGPAPIVPVTAGSAPIATAPAVPWDAAAPVTGGRLAADRLDLTLMRNLGSALPLPASARQWLEQFQPAGVVQGLAARWDGDFDDPRSYRANARLQGLSLAAGPVPSTGGIGRPGWRNANIDVEATEAGGRGTLALDQGVLEFPGVFDNPVIPFDRLGATIEWRIEHPRDRRLPDAITVDVRDMRFANADAEGTLQAKWHTGDGAGPGHGARFPGQIDLKGELTRGNAAQLARYLPRALPDTRAYLAGAFVAGSLKAVHFNVRGDLFDFPFQHGGDGEFRVAGIADNVTLAYVPGAPGADGVRAEAPWPVFTQVRGEVVLDRSALEIRNARGRVFDVELQGVHGGVRSLYDKPVLALQGKAQGPLADYLRYVELSPIGGWLRHGLRQASATGAADLSLSLSLPLTDLDRSVVAGSLQLQGDDLRLLPGVPQLAGTRARVEFTQKGFSVGAATAHVFGGDLAFEGGSQSDGSLRFTGQGVATAEGLRHGLDEGLVARLATRLSGQASYRLQLGLLRGQVEYTLTSPLVGLGATLPAPLAKAPELAWPLRIQSSQQQDATGRAGARDVLKVELGNVAQAELQRESGPGATRLLRSAFAIGAPLPAPQPGGVALLRAPALDADAWWALWRQVSAGAEAAPAASAPAVAAAEVAPDYAPRALSLKSPDVLLGGRHLSNVDLQVAPVAAAQGEIWRVAIESDQTHGVVEVRPAAGGRGAHVFARLDRLALNASDAAADPKASAPAITVPTLDIVVDNFELNAKKLGKLEVTAAQAEGARDWRLTRLALTVPEGRFNGSGVWSGAPANRMALDFRLELADSGAFLERLGMGHVLKGGKGHLAGAVAWTGSPLELDYPTLSGKLQVALDAGQFLKADAGAGRLLGVLSLQSLPRRLTLDFRDLFQEGFAFDNVTGDVQVDRGVAHTNNLRMRGVNAAVLMEGSADIHAETEDMRVVVVPEVNAGTASLAYAVINPVVGLGSFLAQMFLRRPLMRAGTREFHVVGPWADPKVEAVEHKEMAGDDGAASDPEPAASAASAP